MKIDESFGVTEIEESIEKNPDISEIVISALCFIFREIFLVSTNIHGFNSYNSYFPQLQILVVWCTQKFCSSITNSTDSWTSALCFGLIILKLIHVLT